MEPRVPFPTGKDSLLHGGPTVILGYPDRARPCRGHRCVIHDSECIWCGRLPDETIADTWARRALAHDRAVRPPAPFFAREWKLEANLRDNDPRARLAAA